MLSHRITDILITLVRKLMFLWVRPQVVGANAEQLQLDTKAPVCYALQNSSFSDRLLLEQVCLDSGLPSSHQRLKLRSTLLRRSFFFLYKRAGHWYDRRHRPLVSDRLKAIAHDGFIEGNQTRVQIVPVSIFWGRAPVRHKSLFKLLFTDSWAAANPLQKLLIVLVHGRGVYVQFNSPLQLNSLVSDSVSEEITRRKLARILRVHFRRVRSAVIGPDLSHRRTLVDSLLRSPEVSDAIEELAQSKQISITKARAKARKYGNEIASNQSMAAIQLFDIILTWLWNKIYAGVSVHHIDQVHELAQNHAVVYVPSHRSHIDYLLLSYVLYRNGLVLPHIAAGVNLNLPLVGPFLRRGGAFFMRRSFKDKPLYGAVFNEYMHALFSRGFPVEYFVEGGRSRTGRLLQPRLGMLGMTVRSFVREQRKPICFVPVNFSYEKVMEARTYMGELRGQKKRKESVLGLIKTYRSLRNSFGRVAVNFGEPIFLNDVLDAHHPDWRKASLHHEEKPDWLTDTVQDLAHRIVFHINQAAVINPINLVASALLATPRESMDERALIHLLGIYRELLSQSPYSRYQVLPDDEPEQWVAHAESLNMVLRSTHPLGDIITLDNKMSILMTYYRNNILHVLTLPALIAACFLNQRTVAVDELKRTISLLFPFIRWELFIHIETAELDTLLDTYLSSLERAGLLHRHGQEVSRPTLDSPEFVSLTGLAKCVIPTLERYYIVTALLLHNHQSDLTREGLEERCTLLAQRTSLLFGINAPEFFDKNLFKHFIARLIERKLLKEEKRGGLRVMSELEGIGQALTSILNADLRQSIEQTTRTNFAEVQAPMKQAS